MGTVLVEEADPPLSVTKSDEVFAEKPHSHGRTIGIGNFFREPSENPIAPERTTHRGAGMHSGQQLVFFFRDQDSCPSYGFLARIPLSTFVASAVS